MISNLFFAAMPGAACVKAFAAVLSLSLYSYTAVHAQNDTPLAEPSTTPRTLPNLIAESRSRPTRSSYLVSTSTSVPEINVVTATPTSSRRTLPSRLCLPTSIVPLDDPVFAIINQSPARKTPITPGEAVTICKSPPWELKLSNWIWSNAQEWLELYTLKYKDSYEVRRHGLVGSIGHRYLGEPNFRCGIGMTQTCVAWCKDVVMAVEDLHEAKNVYFVLSSISHFTGVADLVHVCSPFPIQSFAILTIRYRAASTQLKAMLASWHPKWPTPSSGGGKRRTTKSAPWSCISPS